MDLLILLIQRIADLSNIFAQIVDFACNILVWILGCDFIVELLEDPNLDKTHKTICRIDGFCFKFALTYRRI